VNAPAFATGASAGKARRVLLIDDTPEIAELLSFALRDRGYEVVATGYTDTVNEWVVAQRADALVLDCSVFDMSESLFDMVRDDPAHAALPIVIISDTPETADASLRARQADHVLLIPKPFTGAQVARALDQLLVVSGQPAAGSGQPAAGSGQ
jgi:DNA-binding response OmpR family regulator